jgi:hypothetical protein
MPPALPRPSDRRGSCKPITTGGQLNTTCKSSGPADTSFPFTQQDSNKEVSESRDLNRATRSASSSRNGSAETPQPTSIITRRSSSSSSEGRFPPINKTPKKKKEKIIRRWTCCHCRWPDIPYGQKDCSRDGCPHSRCGVCQRTKVYTGK